MKHFIFFVAAVFLGLFLTLMARQNRSSNQDLRRTIRVYASNSFIKSWGPGPWLKEKFEATCDCRVDYHEAVDSVSLIQRVKSEPQSRAADLVLGFDQYDLEMAQNGLDWRQIKVDTQNFESSVRPLLSRSNFIPYDWGALAFITHKSEFTNLPTSLEDLLNEEFKDQISIQDPRTSSPGMQFLLWLVQVKGEEKAFEYLQKLIPQVKVWAASWSASYGLFDKNQVKMTFSYVTSPVASLKEDPNSGVIALPFNESHPIQFEFLGIPSTCQSCDLAEKFVALILSKDGQKIIMDKNYMFPVTKNVKQGTLFDSLPDFDTLDMNVIPSQKERERLLKKWSQLRRSE